MTFTNIYRSGLLHAGILGLGLYTFLDFQGWFLCVMYLILGSLVTKIKMKEKKVALFKAILLLLLLTIIVGIRYSRKTRWCKRSRKCMG